MGDAVLERNLCFVDTPGYNQGSAALGGLDVISRYMQQQLHRTIAAVNSGNGDLLNLLSGNGGWQVDAILYLISQGESGSAKGDH